MSGHTRSFGIHKDMYYYNRERSCRATSNIGVMSVKALQYLMFYQSDVHVFDHDDYNIITSVQLKNTVIILYVPGQG